MIAKYIEIKGLVQGVGFRPFIYRIAIENNLNGWVDNRTDGVYIKVEGEEENINNFTRDIEAKAPVASNITSVNLSNSEIENFNNFKIVKSKNTSNQVTEISPDIAVCDACLKDIKSNLEDSVGPWPNRPEEAKSIGCRSPKAAHFLSS